MNVSESVLCLLCLGVLGVRSGQNQRTDYCIIGAGVSGKKNKWEG